MCSQRASCLAQQTWARSNILSMMKCVTKTRQLENQLRKYLIFRSTLFFGVSSPKVVQLCQGLLFFQLYCGHRLAMTRSHLLLFVQTLRQPLLHCLGLVDNAPLCCLRHGKEPLDLQRVDGHLALEEDRRKKFIRIEKRQGRALCIFFV